VISRVGGLRVGGAAHVGPPAADGRHGELGGVAVAACRHPPGVRGEVVDPVGHGFALLAGEVVDVDTARVAGRAPGPALVGVLADQLLLFRVDADDRLASGQAGGDLVVDVAELRVAVGVLGAFGGLGVGLHAVSQRPAKQPVHAVMGDAVALPGQLVGEGAGGLGRPPQPGHRVAAGLGLDQRVQRVEQAGVGLGQRLATATGAAGAPGLGLQAGVQVLDPGGDRGPGDPGGAGDQGDPAVAQRPGLGPQHQAALPLVQMRQDRVELRPQHLLVDLHDHRHSTTMTRQTGNVQLILRQALRKDQGSCSACRRDMGTATA
jgi:hypothetical protein